MYNSEAVYCNLEVDKWSTVLDQRVVVCTTFYGEATDNQKRSLSLSIVTHLGAKNNIETRCTGKFQMFRRDFRIEKIV